MDFENFRKFLEAHRTRSFEVGDYEAFQAHEGLYESWDIDEQDELLFMVENEMDEAGSITAWNDGTVTFYSYAHDKDFAVASVEDIEAYL